MVKREDRTIDYVFRVLDIPWCYYATAVLIIWNIWWLWRWEGGLLAGYAFLILAETVLIRKPFEGVHFQPELFWSWRQWEVQKGQVLTNVLMFIPIGVLAGQLWKWRGLLIAVGLSVGIELLQLVSQRGLSEFDDVFHNVAGAVIGIGVSAMISYLKHKLS